MLELVSPGAHLWSLDMDGWHIPCRTELGCCSDSIFHRTLLSRILYSSGMTIESALKSVDARCVRYIIGFSPF